MTMVAVGPYQEPVGPTIDVASVNPTAHNTQLLNASGQYAGVIIRPKVTITLRKILIHITSRNETGGTFVARVETVNTANANPSGTEVGTGASIAAGTGSQTVTLAANATLAANTPYFIGVKCTAAPSAGGVTMSISWNGLFYEGLMSFPYVFSGTTNAIGETGVNGLEDSSGSKVVIAGTLPGTGGGTENWASNSNPDRRGLRFKRAAPGRLIGVFIFHKSNLLDLSILVYDSDGSTLLVNQLFDGDQRASATWRNNFYEFTPVSVVKDTFYRTVLLPGSTPAQDWLFFASVNAQADFDCWPCGQNYHWTEVNGAPANDAAWTNILTKRPVGFSLVFDQADDAAGGGGTVVVGRPTEHVISDRYE